MKTVLPMILLGLLAITSACHAQTDGVIFYADFDHGSQVRAGTGWAADLPATADRLVAGRFGKACRMERARTNLLTPNQASVENGTSGFTGVDLERAATDTAFGAHALRATTRGPGAVLALEPVRARVTSYVKPVKTFVFSAYLRSAQPVKVRLSLRETGQDDAWRTKIEANNKAALDKDPQAKVKPPLDTVTTPGEVTLTPQWQRVAAVLVVDARQPEQTLVGALEALAGDTATIFADGLQLEQAAVYPLSNTDPTTWLPGGATRGPAWLDLAASELGFTGTAGTLSCWVRPLPDRCGGTRAVMAVATLGTGWFTPVWQLGGGQWYAGDLPGTQFKIGGFSGGKAEQELFEPGSHVGSHHLALTWDEKEATGYVDGKPFGRTAVKPGQPASGAMLRMGGSFLENTPMTGDLDEVVLLSKRLSEAEVAALAQSQTPLGGQLPPVLLKRPLRMTFLRSEALAEIPLEPTAPVTVSAEIPALKAKVSGSAAPGRPLVLKLRPWLGAPGAYPLRVTLTTPGPGSGKVEVSDSVEVFEEPQGREFIIYAWGGLDPDLKERGFNSAVCGGRGAYRTLLERGMWVNSRIDVREGVPHPWSPETRERAVPIAQSVAREIIASPGAVSCLVNSEVGDPPFPIAPDGKLQPWFADWMQRETGLTAIPPEVARDPMHVRPDADKIPPAVVPEEYAPLKFLQWWEERGQGYWLLGSHIANTMRAAGLKSVFYYSDQPEATAQFTGMDMVDYWGYPKCPEGLVARFSHASNYARLLGKRFQAMPGTVYWDDGNGLRVTDTDGKRKVLCLSPDCLRENLWLSVACASHSIGLYGIGERHTEVYDKACDQVLTDTYGLIQPVGTLVGGLPEEPAAVAMLATDGLNFVQPGIGDDWVRHWLTRNVSRALARSRVAFDWITDAHVEAGWLNRYAAVALPGAWVLPERTHRALVAYAQAGRKVVADETLRAAIPGVQKLPVKTQAGPQEAIAAEWGAWGQQMREAHARFATVQPADKVFTYTREARGQRKDVAARYIFIINDNREPGPQYEQFKVEQMPADGGGPLRDRGLPTDATVSVPAGWTLYDVLAHEPLAATTRAGLQVVQVHLEPGAAAVLAAVRQPLARLAVTLPASLARGTESALNLKVLDAKGTPVAGRQLVEVRVTSPDGEWAGVQRYQRVTNGTLTVPVRLPLTATTGEWQVSVREWLSGLEATRQFEVR